jgi:hypothetical protein
MWLNSAGRAAVFGLAVVCAGLLYSQGCGGSDPVPVVYRGNVTTVEPPATAARSQTQDGRLASSWRFELVPSAVAQSGTCSEATRQNLRDVFLCVATSHGNAAPGTPTPTPRVTSRCFHVDAGSCEFEADLSLEADHDPVVLIFTNSPDGSGDGDAAFLGGYEPTEFCNGDVVRIPDVDINFPAGTATAGGAIVKELDGCARATVTPTAAPTSVTTPTTTPTGTPATPTPTSEEDTPTPTPSPTGPAPTPTRTPTPCPLGICL